MQGGAHCPFAWHTFFFEGLEELYRRLYDSVQIVVYLEGRRRRAVMGALGSYKPIASGLARFR